MNRRNSVIAAVVVAGAIAIAMQAPEASANGGMPGYGGAAGYGGAGMGTQGHGSQQAFGQAWGSSAANVDWNRFYHYPYVYYPQNFWGQDYFKSSDSLYHRYPTEMRIPVYNKRWHNYYPSNRRFHKGHHFILDTF